MKTIKIRLTSVLAVLWLAGVSEVAAGQDKAPGSPLAAKAEQAWEMAWTRFFDKGTNLFYDYLSSYTPGEGLAHLPTAEEIKAQYPNPCGYGTGMEDCMILGGAMLSAIADRFDVTKEERLKGDIARVFRGVKDCVTVHGVKGFVARGLSPKAGREVYGNSSRDQYTHCVHGLWRYYRSPLSDEATKAEIRALLVAIAQRMIVNVTPENGYDSLRLDGQPCWLGICKMWEVQAHEAARLPMIYAAAWDATGEDRYYQLYRRYLLPAIEQSATLSEKIPAYALVQMQCSLELLHDVEKDGALRATLRELMAHLADISRDRSAHVRQELSKFSPTALAMLGPDWRKVPEWKERNGHPIPQWGEYRKVWHLFREAGESALVPLMVPEPRIPEEQKRLMEEMILQSDYTQRSSCGIVYHIASYWKARKKGVLQ